MKWIALILPVLLSISCSDKKTTLPAAPGLFEKIPLRYAEGFTISKKGALTLIEIKTPFPGATNGLRYLLVPETAPLQDSVQDAKIIRTPVTSIVCTSTTHIPHLDYLGLTDRLIGFPTTDYISSPKMRARIDQGQVTDLGVDKGLNIEQLVSLAPDILMGYTMTADYGQFRKIEQLGVPVIINAEYLEKHPLGRAEWIKFVAAFFNKEAEADSIFSSIEKSYNDARMHVDSVTKKPTVLTGVMYGDVWFLPGGHNYMATLYRDAGCNYLWADNTSSSFIELSFESVFERANNCDLWIGTGPYGTLDQLGGADHRYKKFKAFQEGNVFTYDARIGAKGGNEYLELGYLRPDLILRDLIKIAHPDADPSHQMYFHRKLK